MNVLKRIFSGVKPEVGMTSAKRYQHELNCYIYDLPYDTMGFDYINRILKTQPVFNTNYRTRLPGRHIKTTPLLVMLHKLNVRPKDI